MTGRAAPFQRRTPDDFSQPPRRKVHAVGAYRNGKLLVVVYEHMGTGLMTAVTDRTCELPARPLMQFLVTHLHQPHSTGQRDVKALEKFLHTEQACTTDRIQRRQSQRLEDRRVRRQERGNGNIAWMLPDKRLLLSWLGLPSPQVDSHERKVH